MTGLTRSDALAAVTAPPLQMIRAEIDLPSFHRWAGSRRMISRNVFDEGYAMHCLLTESFGERAPKPFRMMTPRGRARGPSGGSGLRGGPLRLRRCRGRCPARSVGIVCRPIAMQCAASGRVEKQAYARHMGTRTAAWLRSIDPPYNSPLKKSCKPSGNGVGRFPLGSNPASKRRR